MSFALAGTAQEFLGSCIFLFVKHQYDVGDRVRIDNVELEVKHIDLLYTIFRRIDTNRIVQIPNIVSNGVWVENISRSKAMKEQVTVLIAPGTSFDDIEIFRHELQAFVRAPENKRDFLPDVDVEIMNVGDMSKPELRVEATHKVCDKRSRFPPQFFNLTWSVLSRIGRTSVSVTHGGTSL